MSQCPFCQKKIAMSKAFCSKSCKENYFQLIAIQVTKPFVKKLYQMCNEEQRELEIERYAKMHGWRLDLVKNRVEEFASKHGFA
jgi:hypothetical protein